MQRNTFVQWTPAAIACLTLTATLAAAGPRTGPGGGARDDVLRRQSLISQAVNEVGVTGELVDLDLEPEPGAVLVTDILLDGETYTVELRRHSLRAPNYRLLVQVADGSLVEHDPGPVRTMRGEVLGMPGSVAQGYLETDGLHAMIDLHGAGPGDRHWIEPASALVEGGLPGEHLVYHDTGIECHGGTCAVAGHQHEFDGHRTDDHVGRGDDAGDPPTAEAGEGGTAGGDDLCVYFSQVAADTDWEYFDGPGANNISFTQNRIEAILNGVSAQYEIEVQIEFQITAVIVRSDPADPYSNTNSAGQLLNEFESHWNVFQTGIERSQAQLFTGRNVQAGNDFSVIGLASIASVCTPQGYSLVEDINPFVCRRDLTAHELGHNWSAQHCSCPGFTMNPSLTCANQFSTASENSIIAHRNSRSCLEVICPPDNDNCADAFAIGTGDTPYSNIFSTTDGPTETLCNINGETTIGSDVWFRYTSPCEGNITFSICDADYNAKMSLYNGLDCPTGTNTAIACSDDSCADGPEITVFALKDQEFLIRVGGFFAQQGQGTLNITPAIDCFSVPGNDACSSATTLVLGTTFFNTTGASSEGFDECDVNGSASIDKDIWYRYIVGCDGQLTISLCDSDFDTKLAVYTGSCPSGPDEAIACSDDVCGDDAELSFPVTAGAFYRLRVGGAAGASGFGQVTLICDDSPPPCDGDTDGDGFVNVNDLNNVILDWGTDGTANGGDLAAGPAPGSPPDGIVDVNDLNAVIVNWGACP